MRIASGMLYRPAGRLMDSNTAVATGFVIMWSSGFIGARLGTGSSSAITLLMWRFLIVVVLLLPAWGMWRRHQSRPLSRREVTVQVVVGLLAQGVYLLGTVGAVEFGVSAGTTALIAALQPIAAGALAGPVLGDRVSPAQWIGLGTGLLGVGLVVSGDLGGPQSAPAWAYILPFLGMAGLVLATLLESKTRLHTPLPDSLAIQCAASAVLFTLLGFGTGLATPPVHSPGFWAAVTWFIVFSTLGGYGFYWLALKRTSITHLSGLIYLTPPTTMVWAFLMFGDTIGLVSGLGLIVCLVAVLLIRPARLTVPAAPSKASNG